MIVTVAVSWGAAVSVGEIVCAGGVEVTVLVLVAGWQATSIYAIKTNKLFNRLSFC
jgi:uncharacterized membrane protein (DUF485 family)